jgi:hypothetical protein
MTWSFPDGMSNGEGISATREIKLKGGWFGATNCHIICEFTSKVQWGSFMTKFLRQLA